LNLPKTAAPAAALACALAAWPSATAAQTVAHRGFVDVRGFAFPQTAPNDQTRLVGELFAREEAFVSGPRGLEIAAGLDVRASSHDRVEDEWRIDFSDRTLRRPRASIRRLSATLALGRLTVDAGKQFIRWGRADILNPTDRFSPRDFMDVIDSPFLPVAAVRPTLQIGNQRVEFVWVPRMTPSRLPLLNQRWTVVPQSPPAFNTEDTEHTEVGNAIDLRDGGALFPDGPQYGARWNYTGQFIEGSFSFFDGFNHLPLIDAHVADDGAVLLTRRYPELRAYGGDVAIPSAWFTIKAEAAYFTNPSNSSNPSNPLNPAYVLYVVELERQIGEWSLVGGYVGEVVVRGNVGVSFAPDRGMARSFLGRAAYTVDPRRTVAVEGVIRENGEGMYVRGEYSQAFAQNWRLTLSGVGIAGRDTDFLGQYYRNSHSSIGVRFSF
jgi:hypothetical protein